MEPVVPDGQNGPFPWSNDLWRRITTSVKTLIMEPVGPDSQNNPFSRSNEPQSREAPIWPIFVRYS
ncbi:hypothetical protein H5410_053004 [Solanum commersonii]|uniref:Uncharacterized protein n=1 Tax=Solanum commersonii TaxID=4109 RepID=A0A9J5X2C3_SOLCO|nr:hypothetical protein H5410_053004 [Solanum commersonii]